MKSLSICLLIICSTWGLPQKPVYSSSYSSINIQKPQHGELRIQRYLIEPQTKEKENLEPSDEELFEDATTELISTSTTEEYYSTKTSIEAGSGDGTDENKHNIWIDVDPTEETEEANNSIPKIMHSNNFSDDALTRKANKQNSTEIFIEIIDQMKVNQNNVSSSEIETTTTMETNSTTTETSTTNEASTTIEISTTNETSTRIELSTTTETSTIIELSTTTATSPTIETSTTTETNTTPENTSKEETDKREPDDETTQNEIETKDEPEYELAEEFEVNNNRKPNLNRNGPYPPFFDFLYYIYNQNTFPQTPYYTQENGVETSPPIQSVPDDNIYLILDQLEK